MRYLSGKFALDIPDEHLNCDWHSHALLPYTEYIQDTKGTILGEWGIEQRNVDDLGLVYVANHARACLDLIIDGKYGSAGGMKNDYVNGAIPQFDIFCQVIKLSGLSNWKEIDQFMGREYSLAWLRFKKKRGIA